jgi:hypothetical protein
MVGVGDRTPPLSCLRPPTVPKAYQIPANIPVFRLLTLSNLFIVNSRWVDGDRVKMALYRAEGPLSRRLF